MYIESVPNRGSKPTILLRESTRENGRVIKRTLANLTDWPDDLVANFKLLLKGEALVPLTGFLTIEQSFPHGHVHAILETIRRLKFDTIIASRFSRTRDLILAMIVSQLIRPSAEPDMTRQWHQTTLAQTLAVEDATEDDIDIALDWLLRSQNRIEAKLAKSHLSVNRVILYVISNSTSSDSRYSLETQAMKHDDSSKPCIAYGLLTNHSGCPIALHVFPEYASETTTIYDQVEKLRTRFGFRRVVLVGDRGIITTTRIEELCTHKEIGWISTLRTEEIRSLVNTGALQQSLFDKQNLVEITSKAFPGERLVACYNPRLAAEHAQTRAELLEACEHAFDSISAEVRRQTRTPMTEQQITSQIGTVHNYELVSKLFHFTIADNHFSYERDEASITAEKLLDGISVIRTSEPTSFSVDDTVRTFKGLSNVKSAFQREKNIDLCFRPIRYWTNEHARAHVFLYTLAYYVQWQMCQALAPLLYTETHPHEEKPPRAPVTKAKPSTAERHKENHTGTDNDLPLHSWETLMNEMGMLCRNRCSFIIELTSRNVELDTIPSELQSRVFELLGISL